MLQFLLPEIQSDFLCIEAAHTTTQLATLILYHKKYILLCQRLIRALKQARTVFQEEIWVKSSQGVHYESTPSHGSVFEEL